tara:strand:- start:6424 stop:7191 length:768 start_codon:yes stop_codon:yes gene_type:complete
MQLVSRYLATNHSVVVSDGFTGKTEYRKVYQRNIKITKGIDNVITFEIKNSDHKPLSILNTYTPYVEVFTEDDVLLKRYIGTIKETSTPSYKGQFTINITDADTLNIDGQYLSYVVYLNKTADATNTLTYADDQFGPSGTIELTGSAFPGARDSKEVVTFLNDTSSVVDAEPHINSNVALHTAAIYSTGFAGTVKIQGTLGDNTSTSWFDITTATLSSPTTPHYVNFNGVFSFLRFVKTNDAGNSGSIDKILVRN